MEKPDWMTVNTWLALRDALEGAVNERVMDGPDIFGIDFAPLDAQVLERVISVVDAQVTIAENKLHV